MKDTPLILVELSASEIPIEPGGTAQLTVTVHNKQEHDDHVALELEGVDVEWYALPVPTLNIPAGESRSANVLFRIERSSSSHAGAYPFLVRARGMETGDSGVQQATLNINHFSSLQVELNPKRGASTFFQHGCVFDVVVTNLGNREESLDLSASDPEDACAYEFETDRVTVKPGHSETVPILVEPVTRPMIGASRLYGFVVRARSVQDAYVSSNAHGQLDRRPLLTTLTAAVLLAIVLLGAAVTIFWPRAPKPPMIHSFTASTPDVMAGDPVTLQWDVSDVGERSAIRPDNIPVTSTIGSVIVKPDKTTNYVLVVRNGTHEAVRTLTVTVRERPVPPRPVIRSFTARPARIHAGDTVNLNWEVAGATEVMLNPLGRKDDPGIFKSQIDKPDKTLTYILSASGPGGVVSKSVTVTVLGAGESLAQIVYFRAKPESVEQGKASSLSWSAENASSLEIDNGVGGGLKPKGKFDVTPAQTTVYTLRVMDDKGNLRTAQVKVTVTLPTPQQETPDNTNPPVNNPPP